MTENTYTSAEVSPDSAEEFFSTFPPGTTSETFIVPASIYAKTAIFHAIVKWWWLITLPIVAAILCSITMNDLRFAFLGLIIIFLIAPFIIVNSYFRTLLNPTITRLTLPTTIATHNDHSLTFTTGDNPTYTITFSAEQIITIHKSPTHWRISIKGLTIPILIPLHPGANEPIDRTTIQ